MRFIAWLITLAENSDRIAEAAIGTRWNESPAPSVTAIIP